jgi:GWxTD domain-containing protein
LRRLARASTCALLLLLAACGAPPAVRRSTELLNPRLSPGLSQWLVGAISHLATEEEVQQYLAFTDDAQAQAFIGQFWTRRDPRPPAGGNPLKEPNLRELFEARATDADHRFSETGYLGRRTDRGTIFILYGEPKSIDFDLEPGRPQSAAERWTYSQNAPVGLDGKKPSLIYRFVKAGDRIVLQRTFVAPPPLAQPSGTP